MEILRMIQSWVMQTPGKLAFINGSRQLTYQELWDDSDALSVWISQNNKEKRQVVVYGHMQSEMIVAFLACVKAGCAYVPVDASAPEHRVQAIVRKSQADLFFAFSPIELKDNAVHSVDYVQYHLLIEQYNGKKISWETEMVGTDNENFYIIYTSGSTGEPKGVQITHRCLESFVSWVHQSFPTQHQQRFLNQAPFSFDLSVMDIYPALTSGGTVWALDKDLVAKPPRLFEQLSQSNLSVWVSTPSFADFCLMDKAFNQSLLPELKVFLFCGEVLSPITVHKLRKRFPDAKVYNTFGPTEATVAVTALEITDDVIEKYPTLPVGYCKSDCEIFILNEDGERCKDEEKGEIVIAGPSVSPGYLHNPELTEMAFFQMGSERAYRTGDIGYLIDGLLFYHGRKDFQVKLHGYRIEIEEVEYHLRSLPAVKSAAVVPVFKDNKCDHLVAFVATDDQADSGFAISLQLKKELAKRIPDYMIPRRLIIKEQLSLTPNGKVDRKQLALEVST